MKAEAKNEHLHHQEDPFIILELEANFRSNIARRKNHSEKRLQQVIGHLK